MSNRATNADSAGSQAAILRGLIQTAVLAAVLIPLGTVAVESATVTCGFSSSYEGYYGGTYCNGGDSSADPNRSRFDFGTFWLELEFTLVPGAQFDVTVVTTEDTDFVQGKAGDFEGYTCIGITSTGECVDFEVIPSEPALLNWTHYEIEIHWNKIDGQVLDTTLMTMLHDVGPHGSNDELLRDYDTDMCALTGVYDACEIDPDPGIRSGDTDFRSFAAFQRPAAVPEPSSLLLLGTGIGGILFGRRRRS